MKLSKYNTYLNISSRIGCIYNSFTDKAIVFCGDAKGIESSKCVPENLNAKFLDNGILVDDDIDEFDRFVEWARSVEKSDDVFHLMINPTLNCNFNCHYCYESHFKSKMSPDIMGRVKRLIVEKMGQGMNLVISFFGGEPMLYYENIMKPLILFAISQAKKHQLNFSCNMTSNGFLLDEERIKWLGEHAFDHAQITLDGSKEMHNKVRYRFEGDNTYDKIVENIGLLAKHGIGVTLRLNCTHDNIVSLTDIAPSFEHLSQEEKKKIVVDTHVVWQEANQKILLDSMDKIVSSFTVRGIPGQKMDFRGFCYADRINSCLVNFNGDVFKCSAKDFSKIPRDGFIDEQGNIIWENDSLNKRMQSKFRNHPCKECRIFPLCHGGCSTNSLEHHDYCMHRFSDVEKEEVVKNRIIHNSNNMTP